MELTWIGAAFVAGAAAKSLRLPTLVGYLAAGLVLALLGIESNEVITTVGDLGVALLLFTVGLHINLRSLVQIQVLGVGSVHFLISTTVFTGVLIAFQLELWPAIVLAAGFAFSSTVLTAKSLDSRGELDSYHGRLAIGILILQDVIAVVLLVFTGGGTPSLWALGLIALPLARPLLTWLMYAVGRDELLLIFGMLITLGAGWLFELVGMDAKLGALVLGMVLAGDPRSDELYDMLWGLKELFLVGFFLKVGLGGLPDGDAWGIIGLIMVFLPLKGILFFVLMIVFRLRARTSFLSSISLTAYSEFALIVATGAAASSIISNDWVVKVGIVVALSYTINAPISRFVNELWLRFEPTLIRFERDISHPDHEPRSLGLADYVVIGMGRAGTAAYDYLVEQGHRPLGFEADPAQIQRHLTEDRRVIYGDANDPELWTGLDLSHLEGVLLTINNVTADTRTIHALRDEGFNGFVAALARYQEHKDDLEAAGVNVSFLPIKQAGRELAQACLGQLTSPGPAQPIAG